MADGVAGDFVCGVAVFCDLVSQSAAMLDWFLVQELDSHCFILALCVWDEHFYCSSTAGGVDEGVRCDFVCVVACFST